MLRGALCLLQLERRFLGLVIRTGTLLKTSGVMEPSMSFRTVTIPMPLRAAMDNTLLGSDVEKVS